MGFNIPMNTRGSMSADSLLSLNSGSSMGNSQPALETQMQQSVLQAQPHLRQPVRQRPQGGGVHLKKGQRVSLGENTLTNVQICLGWDVLNVSADLDASAFLLGADGKVVGDDWFVFYGQPNSPDNSVRHSGDSTGEGMGDDEIISINLQQVNPSVSKIVFIVTIDEALAKGLNFSMVQNAYVRAVDMATKKELIRFILTDYYANVTAMIVGELYNKNGIWKFSAVGNGVAKDLAGLCKMYGVHVADE